MKKYARKKEPPVRPVRKIELSESNTRLRLLAVVFLLCVAAVAFTYGFSVLLNGEPGWQEIEVPSSADINCSSEFVFQYYVGGSGASASSDKKAVTLLYQEACEKAYEMFTTDAEAEEGEDANIGSINAHPNETLTVDPALYEALSKVDASGLRNLFLGPVYERYENLFYCNDDSETVNYDPQVSDEVREEYAELLDWAMDGDEISLALLGDNQVCLRVSEAYLAFAEENEIKNYIDFGWMKNAFILDYLAESIADAGYQAGCISSYDGFTRNLGESGLEYSFNLYDRQDYTIYSAGVLNYTETLSIVYLRNYPMSDLDQSHYYERSDGQMRTIYLDTADGICKSADDNLVCCSASTGCADILLAAIPVYIADTWDAGALDDLEDAGIYSVWYEDYVICTNLPDADIGDLYDEDGVSYELEER